MDDFTQKLLLRNDELEKEIRNLRVQGEEMERENRSLRRVAQEGERAIAQRERAVEKLRAADKSQAAAERRAERERHARLGAEEEIDVLKRRIVHLQEQPSRLAKLREELGV